MEGTNNQADAIILGAGKGRRMMSDVNKMFHQINSIPLLYRTLYRFQMSDCINKIVVVLRPEEQKAFNRIIKQHGKLSKIAGIVDGGIERADSVRNGLRFLMDNFDTDAIMTHDGARPFFSEDLLKNLIVNSKSSGICIPVLNVAETVRKIDKDKRTKVINRDALRLTQTPQVFARKHIEECFFSKKVKELVHTDEASYFENRGFKVTMIPGEKWNIKVTNKEDILWSECLLAMNNNLRLNHLE